MWVFVPTPLYYAWRVSNRPNLSRSLLYVTAMRACRLIGASTWGIYIFATVIYTVLYKSISTLPRIIIYISHIAPVIIMGPVYARLAHGSMVVPFETSRIVRRRKIIVSIIITGKTVTTKIIKISILLSKITCCSKIISAWIRGKITTSKIILILKWRLSVHIWMRTTILSQVVSTIARISIRSTRMPRPWIWWQPTKRNYFSTWFISASRR